MNQLTQKLKSGVLTIQELPMPRVGPGAVLVRNHFSLISAGTEGSTVRTARKSYIGKAKERPQQVKQVLEAVRQFGPVQTYRAVMKKLDAYSPLGYSSAGEVIEVGAGVARLAVGDKVACAGAGYANHAEVVCVPENLCVRLTRDADLRQASYNTLGAIAMQGVRQADVRLGETCVVIGLGLLGQLTCLILRASGVTAYGIDVDPFVVKTAAEHCCDGAWVRDTPGLAEQIDHLTGGLGSDAVIVAAATDSVDPVNLAGRLARKKGKVVVVGAVPTGFDREPHYYRKELELRMSCSYGPGRYDPDYEERGHDYPAAYVRWTENRNMQAFQELIARGRINLDYLTTHEFALEQAADAYEMILQRTEDFIGVVLAYDVESPLARRSIPVWPSQPQSAVNVAFIGAGSYAQSNLLPHISAVKDVTLRGVMTNTGTTSKRVAERFGFEFCADSLDDILAHPHVDTVFVASRHDTHGHYVKCGLRAQKHVFTEKPLCLTLVDLEEIQTLACECAGRHLMVGFNRRFAPLAVELKRHVNRAPLAMLYRINAGAIPKDHWIQDPDVGGGRVIGEVCHFIDFLTWLSGSLPRSVQAVTMSDPDGLHDTLSINVEFRNGSIGNICYFANGSKALHKEHIEVYQGGMTGVLSDFRTLRIYAGDRVLLTKKGTLDKGQRPMLQSFLSTIRDGGSPLIPADELFRVTKSTFAVLESLRTRRPVDL